MVFFYENYDVVVWNATTDIEIPDDMRYNVLMV